MLEIRKYIAGDAKELGVLIADTYSNFNLAHVSPEKRAAMLGPFSFARSSLPEHQAAIADALSAPSVWIAEERDGIIGVLRGGRTDDRGRTVLSSLFVCGQHHRQGIGSALVEHFEQEFAARGTVVFKLSATLYAVPFYLHMGYKRSTGVRIMRSFGETGLPYQPMKKIL